MKIKPTEYIETWEEFVDWAEGDKNSESINAPMKKKVYNEPSITFYKDGSVWVSGAKGCVRIFKYCPPDLMYSIWIQRHTEVDHEDWLIEDKKKDEV